MIDSILLIDDSPSDNFIHRKVIEHAGLNMETVIKHDGEQAMNYLRDTHGTHKYPSLIFLDINMPKMNGWEFLEAFNQLPEQDKQAYVVTMLTTSMNPQDHEKADKYDLVSDYINKPLTQEIFQHLVKRYFPEEFN